jgi:two-component system, chemotaxis family, sensor kinase CheA
MDLSQPANGPNEIADEMAEVINEFLVESNEGLDRFDRDLIALEKDRTSRELLDSIFRAVHTIKGTGGVLGYQKLVSVSHLGESVLSRMRDGVLLLSPEIATALLTMADSLRHMLESIASAGEEGDEDNSSVLEQLSAVLQRGQADPPKPAATTSPCSPIPRLGEILIDA